MGFGYGLVGLIIVALDIWAIVKTLGSSASDAAKIIWTLVILVLPLIGLIAWALAGPRGPSLRTR
jgi:hypothetical protein